MILGVYWEVEAKYIRDPLMTQGLIFSMNRTKIVLDHKLSPRSPTMAFSSVRENVTPTPSWNCVGKYYCILYFINCI